jgi:Cu-Zn family superoxide dismutase
MTTSWTSDRTPVPAASAQLLDGDSSAIVVHEQADSYMDPASAGGRLACGVVEQLS